jgi:hypothetical protein
MKNSDIVDHFKKNDTTRGTITTLNYSKLENKSMPKNIAYNLLETL